MLSIHWKVREITTDETIYTFLNATNILIHKIEITTFYLSTPLKANILGYLFDI